MRYLKYFIFCFLFLYSFVFCLDIVSAKTLKLYYKYDIDDSIPIKKEIEYNNGEKLVLDFKYGWEMRRNLNKTDKAFIGYTLIASENYCDQEEGKICVYDKVERKFSNLKNYNLDDLNHQSLNIVINPDDIIKINDLPSNSDEWGIDVLPMFINSKVATFLGIVVQETDYLEYNFKYTECKNIQDVYSYTEGVHSFKDSEKNPWFYLKKCGDIYFEGWNIKVGNNYFCSDKSDIIYLSSTCKKKKLFKGGDRIWEGYFFDDVTIEAVNNYGNSCFNNKNSINCRSSGCVWNEDYNFCSPFGIPYLKCGDAYDIPVVVPQLTSYAVTLLKTVAPIILIFISVVQLVKSITASKEDEIKKAQSSMVKRFILAGLIFLIVTIVQFIMLKLVSDDEKGNFKNCLSCFLNGPNKCDSIYFKDNFKKCFYIDNDGEGGNYFDCD